MQMVVVHPARVQQKYTPAPRLPSFGPNNISFILSEKIRGISIFGPC